MKVLLDTHIMLWAMTGDPRLSKIAREVIEDMRNELYFSAASLCEISLKHKIHEDQMPVSLPRTDTLNFRMTLRMQERWMTFPCCIVIHLTERFWHRPRVRE